MTAPAYAAEKAAHDARYQQAMREAKVEYLRAIDAEPGQRPDLFPPQRMSARDRQKMADLEAKAAILAALRETPGLNNLALARALGQSPDAVKRRVDELLRDRSIKSEGQNKHRRLYAKAGTR